MANWQICRYEDEIDKEPTFDGNHFSAMAMDIHPFPQPSSATVLSLKIESGCRFSPSQKVKDQSSGTKMLGITIVVNFFLPRQPAFGPQEREGKKRCQEAKSRSMLSQCVRGIFLIGKSHTPMTSHSIHSCWRRNFHLSQSSLARHARCN